jgi:hypothetical protein
LLATIAGIDLTVPRELTLLTLLAPTNEAFAKLPTEMVDFLLSPEGKEICVTILTDHVLVGVYTISSELEDGAKLTSRLEGRAVTVSIGETDMLSSAVIVAVDILANNGVLHKIDEVLAQAVPADLLKLLFSNDEFIPPLQNLLLYQHLPSSGEFFAIDLLDALFADTYLLKYHVFLDVITLDEFAEGT